MTEYIVYGKIDSISNGVLNLNSGHKIAISASNLIDDEGNLVITKGQTRFFTVKGNTLNDKIYTYINSSEFDYGPSVDVVTRNLDQQLDNVMKSFDKLDAADRMTVCRAIGIGVSGVVSFGAAASAAYETYEFFTGGPFNPMNLLTHAGIAAGSAWFAAISYEGLTIHLKQRADALKRLQKAQNAYSRVMLKSMPLQGSHLECLNPQANSLINKSRQIFEVSIDKAHDFWHSCMEVKPSWVGA